MSTILTRCIKPLIKVSISNYKSIDSLQLDIKPVTVLIGPPNTGKSNILEALYLAGLPGKLYMALKEYENAEKTFCERDASIKKILRITDPSDIFPNFMYEKHKPVTVKTTYEDSSAETVVKVEAGIDELRLNVQVSSRRKDVILVGEEKISQLIGGITLTERNNYCIDLHRLAGKKPGGQQSSRSKNNIEGENLLSLLLGLAILKMFTGADFRNIGEILLESRLYSYSRFTLDSRFDILATCKDNTKACRAPKHILAEDAGNIAWIAYRNPEAVSRLNEWLNTKLGTGIEVLVKMQPSLEFYEKPMWMKPSLVSDGVKRALYYILALASSISYANLKKVNMLLLLEEPEAKLYPYIQDLLLYWLGKAVNNDIHVVLTTHNPQLVDMLAESFTRDKLGVYYVYREPMTHNTRIQMITGEKLTKLKAYSLGDLLVMTPKEVASESDRN